MQVLCRMPMCGAPSRRSSDGLLEARVDLGQVPSAVVQVRLLRQKGRFCTYQLRRRPSSAHGDAPGPEAPYTQRNPFQPPVGSAFFVPRTSRAPQSDPAGNEFRIPGPRRGRRVIKT